MSPYWIALIAVAAAGLCYYAYRFYGLYQAKREDPERWEKEISAIESRYSEFKPTGRIVFLGSSSIRLWETLEEDMAPFDVLNHGFGGSKAVDSTYYLSRLVYPFKPKDRPHDRNRRYRSIIQSHFSGRSQKLRIPGKDAPLFDQDFRGFA